MRKKNCLLLSVFLMLISMLSISASGVSAQESDGEEKGSSAPLHYETEKGIVNYVGQEYASAGMLLRTEEDPSKTIILNFDYTISGDQPGSFSTDFEVCAYQNDLGLNSPASYNKEACTQGIINYYSSDTFLPNQTVPIGVMFVLEDESPVTVIVRDKGSDDYSDSMVIDLVPYVDKSFNLNYLYGRWQDSTGTKDITFTSSTIRYSEGTSSREMSSSLVWAEESVLHQPIDELGKTMNIVQEPGQPLRLISDVATLTQLENWPEEPLPEEQAAAPEQAVDPAAVSEQTGDPSAPAPDQTGDPAAMPDQAADAATEPAPEQTADPAASAPSVQVMYDNPNCYMAVTDVMSDDLSMGVNVVLHIENRTDRDLLFSITDAAISGAVVPASWSATIPAGQTSDETISWTGYDIETAGIVAVSDIQVSFRVNEAAAPDGAPLHEDRLYIAP